MGWKNCQQTLCRVFEYNTPLVLHTNSVTIGITFRILQLFICLFIFLYYIGYKGGYQAISYTIISSTTLERKDLDFYKLAEQKQYAMAVDVKGSGEIFVPAAALITVQHNSTCAEDPRMRNAQCNPMRNHCVRGNQEIGGNGVMTGQCIPYPKSNKYTCQIRGWCTFTEEKQHLFKDVIQLGHMAVVLENHVYFPEFSERGHRKNFDKLTPACWAKGHYYSSTHPFCPVFKLSTIAEMAAKGPKATPFTYEELTSTGGILLIRIIWDCNFDIKDPAKQCSIEYQFRRMDPVTDVASKSPDFRHIDHVAGFRTLSYIYGIRVITSVEGRARQFDLFTFLTRLGASAGLFAAAALFCEILLTCACCANEQKIRNVKYVEITKISQIDDHKLIPLV